MLVFLETFSSWFLVIPLDSAIHFMNNCRLGTTSSPHQFFLRDSRASETRARVKNHPARERRDSAAVRVLSPYRVSPFSREVIFTRAHVSLTPLFLRENGDHLQSRTTVAVFVCLFACLFICWQNGGDSLNLQYGITNIFLFSHQKNLLTL